MWYIIFTSIHCKSNGKLLTYIEVAAKTEIPNATVRAWHLDKGLTTIEEMRERKSTTNPKGSNWECAKDITGDRGFNKTKCCLKNRGMDKCKHYHTMTETWEVKQPLPRVCNEARGDTCPNFDTGRDW